MEIEFAFIRWLQRFGMIHGFLMIITWAICALVRPDQVMDVSFLGCMILISLAGTLPGFIYVSKEELTDRQWWFRTVIHYLLLNLLLLPISRILGLWEGAKGLAAVAAIILIVDVFLHVMLFGLDWLQARAINRTLAEHRRTQQESDGSAR